MTDRAEQVRKAREAAAMLDAERMTRKKLKLETPNVPFRKTGCSFCSHCRKKIKDGFTKIKNALLEG